MPEGQNKPIGPQLPELLPAFKALRSCKSLMLYGFWDEELIDMAAAAAAAEAAVADLDIEGSEDVTFLDIPAVREPVPAEPISGPVIEEELVPVGEAEGTPILDVALAAPAAPPPPLPAVVAAEKVSDTEFSEAVATSAEPDPVQEWETLVFASAPVAAYPID